MPSYIRFLTLPLCPLPGKGSCHQRLDRQDKLIAMLARKEYERGNSDVLDIPLADGERLLDNHKDRQKKLLQGVLKGFKSKQGKKFSAIVAFDSDFNTQFFFPKKKTGVIIS